MGAGGVESWRLTGHVLAEFCGPLTTFLVAELVLRFRKGKGDAGVGRYVGSGTARART